MLLEEDELVLDEVEEEDDDVDDVDDADDDDEEAEESLGFSPSLRACSSAPTSSLFSRKLFVLMPYDSNSFLISPARMVGMSGSVEAHRRDRATPLAGGTTKDLTSRRRLEASNESMAKRRNRWDLLGLNGTIVVSTAGPVGGCCVDNEPLVFVLGKSREMGEKNL